MRASPVSSSKSSRATAAIKLYERAGFEHEGRRRRAVRIDGKALDVLLMAKDVSALSVDL